MNNNLWMQTDFKPNALSRLDYIAALLMASYENHVDGSVEEHAEWAVSAAKVLITKLDKEQQT